MRMSLGSLASYGASFGASSYGDANVPEIFTMIRKKWAWIVVPTLLALCLSTIVVNLLTPRYTAESKLLLEARDTYFTRPSGDQRELPLQLDSEAVQSQVQVVMSRDLAKEAIKKLELVGNPEFDPLADTIGSLRKVLVVLGLSKNPIDKSPEERILEAYYDNLLVFPTGRSRVITVEFRSKNPELSARASNVISELYIQRLESSKKDTARNASSWLSNTIEPLRIRVAEAEAKVEEYRAKNGLLTAGQNNTTLISQQLSDLSTQLAAARTARADAQAKVKLIKQVVRSGRAFEIPDVANNELIRRLVEQRVTMRAQLALEMRTLLSEHPRIKELEAQLFDLEHQMRAAVERVINTLENEAKIAASRVDSLLSVLETQKQSVIEANENEVQLRALERDAKTQREQLESYMVKYREALARDAENAVMADARIVSRAVVPNSPSFPKKLPTIMVITLATLFLCLGIVLGRSLFEDHSRGGSKQKPSPKSLFPAGGVEFIPSHIDNSDKSVQKSEPKPDSPQNQSALLTTLPLRTTGIVRPKKNNALQENDPSQNQVARAGDDDASDKDTGGGKQAVSITSNEKLPSERVEKAALSENGNTASVLKGSSQLLRALKRIPIEEGRGRKILCIFEDNKSSYDAVKSVINELKHMEKGMYLQFPPQHEHAFPGPVGEAYPDDLMGLTDLVAGEVTFSDVIVNDETKDFHWIPAGLGVVDEIIDDTETLDVILKALEQTYGWVLCGLPSDSAQKCLPLLMSRMDNVVVVASAKKSTPSFQLIVSELSHVKGGKVILVKTENGDATKV
jgi:polysaccharide biosynthesis transport protein